MENMARVLFHTGMFRIPCNGKRKKEMGRMAHRKERAQSCFRGFLLQPPFYLRELCFSGSSPGLFFAGSKMEERGGEVDGRAVDNDGRAGRLV